MSISQNYSTAKPTLNLNFARSKTLDPRVTFTRSSSAVVTNSNGILRTVAVDRPRFDHDPITGESLGLLVEEQRTNIVPLSNLIGQTTTYASAASTINTFNSLLAPDNTFTATLTDNNGNGNNFIYGGANSTLSTNTTYTYSIFVKQGTKPDFQVTIDENGFGGKRYYISFTFSTETITTGITGLTNDGDVIRSSYIKYPNSWYRLTLTFRTSTNTVGSFIDMINRFGNTAGSNYVWGRQLEVGLFPTSYIPTVPTFTSRASTATFYDSTGTLRTAATNIARSDAYFPDSSNVFRSGGLLLEAAATNLFGNSSFIQRTDISFPDLWEGWNPATFLKSTTLAPDGISYGLFHGAVNQNGGGLKRDFTGLSASTTYVISFWARSITSSELTYFTNNNSRGTTTGTADGAQNVAWFAATQARFDIQNINGTGGSGAAQFVLSNTWKRFSGTITTDSAGSIRIFISNNVSDTGTGNEDGGGVWMIWGAQLEQPTSGITASSYIPTLPSFASRASSATYYDVNGILRTAAINEARNNAYVPESSTVFRGPNWLVENAATNLLLYSEDFSAASWVKTASTSVTTNTTTAPDGTLTADTVSNTANINSYIGQPTTLLNNTRYTVSLFVRPLTTNKIIVFEFGNPSTSYSVGTFNLSTLTFSGTGPGNGYGSITTLSNGWYRISYSITTSATGSTTFNVIYLGAYGTTSDSVSFALWGAQLETGSTATSYIQTVATTATRAADVVSYPSITRAADVFSSPSVTRSADTVTISGSNFSSFYNQSEGTFLWEGKFNITRDDNDAMFSVNNGSVGEQRFSIRRGNTLATTTGSNFINGINTGLTTNLGRVAFAYKSGSYAIVTNGTINSQPTSTQVPTPDRITQFNAYEGDVVRNSIHHRKLVYYPFRLSNSQLQAITK